MRPHGQGLATQMGNCGFGRLLLNLESVMVYLINNQSMHCRAERTRAVTSVFGSLDVGSVVGLLVSGPLIRRYGWPSVFYLFAALGLIWSALWPLLKPGDPDPSAHLVPRPQPGAGSKLNYLLKASSLGL